MKAAVLLTLSLLWTGSAMERNLQDCPVPGAYSCEVDSNPVKCGTVACEFDNQCRANAAGFSPGVCWPATCTTPDPSIACTTDSNPVLCGDNYCEYANYCNAEAAGFPPTVCQATNCPPGAGNACPANLDEHICLVQGTGLCRYSNECFATDAGLDPNMCLRTAEYVNNVLGNCPIIPPESVCPLVYEPVRCGDCFYVSGGFCVCAYAETMVWTFLIHGSLCRRMNVRLALLVTMSPTPLRAVNLPIVRHQNQLFPVLRISHQ